MHPADPRVALLRDHLVGYVLEGTDRIRFHLRELIGEGGQGWIYKGNYDEPDGVPIVIKVLRPDGITEDTLRRFQREAAVLRQLGAQANPNPNLVRFYDHGIVELCPPNSSPLDKVDVPFTVLEYVHGKTLAEIIRDQQGVGLGAGRARRLMRQVAFALTSVHAQNIIHRDLKPSNILVTVEHGTEVVKVTDFGLAKLVDVGAQKTTMLAGASIGYAPPEQYEKGNERVTSRTDVYSFAVILFECLAGTAAFPYKPGDNAMKLIQEMISGPRPSLAAAHGLTQDLRDNRHALSVLDSMLSQAMQPNPEPRPASVREFWDAVDPLLRTATEVSIRAPAPAAGKPMPRESVNPEVEAASGQYAFRSLGRLARQDELRSAVIAPDGKSAFALGALGVYHWGGSAWQMVGAPSWLDPAVLRGLAILPDATLLLFGNRGTVVGLAPGGEAQPWRLPDDDVELRAALVERAGIAMVGKRRSTDKGAWVEAPYGRPLVVRSVDTTSALNAVARLAGGALVACGNDGALTRIDVSTTPAIPWARTGHLLSIAARADGGAFAVGSGGHALSISPNFQVALEPVQTTRDLVSVAVGVDGSAWAGATERRILQRRATTWARVPLGTDTDDKTTIMAVRPLPDSSVLAIASDGQVLEGRRAS